MKKKLFAKNSLSKNKLIVGGVLSCTAPLVSSILFLRHAAMFNQTRLKCQRYQMLKYISLFDVSKGIHSIVLMARDEAMLGMRGNCPLIVDVVQF